MPVVGHRIYQAALKMTDLLVSCPRVNIDSFEDRFPSNVDILILYPYYQKGFSVLACAASPGIVRHSIFAISRSCFKQISRKNNCKPAIRNTMVMKL